MNSPEVRVESEPLESSGLLIRRVAAVFERVPERDRLRAVLALGPALAGVENAVVLVGDAVVAAYPGTVEGRAAERLHRRVRGVFETEQFVPPYYVARIGARGQGRIALRWGEVAEADFHRAQAFATLCGWALDAADLARLPSIAADRTATLRRIEQLVRGALRGRRRFALLHVDVEDAARERAEGLAHGLRRVVRATDHVGYLGANAYAVLVAVDAHEIEAFVAAQRVLAAARERWCAHVGVAVYPDDGARVEDLLEKASAAALAATSAGSGLPYWFREETGVRLRDQAQGEQHLRDAAETQALTLRCRPAFEPYTGAVCGVFTEADGPEEPFPAVAPIGKHVRGALDQWTVRAAIALATPMPVPRVYVRIAEITPPLVDMVLSQSGMREGTRRLALALGCTEIDPSMSSALRQLRTLGVAIGMDALCAAAFAQRGGAVPDLDFVTVDAGTSMGTLAALACGSILAPQVIVFGVSSLTEGRWLARHGATVLGGPGLAPDVGAGDLPDALTRTVAL